MQDFVNTLFYLVSTSKTFSKIKPLLLQNRAKIKNLMIEELLVLILAKQCCFDHFEQTNNYFLFILVFF